MSDKINPDHYKNSTSLECIEAMEIVFGKEYVLAFCVLNAFKYIWRWKNKNGQEDLGKAKWYVNRARYYIWGPDGCNDIDITNKFSDIVGNMGTYIIKMKKELENEQNDNS